MEATEIQDSTSGLVRLVGVNSKYHVAPVYLTPKFNEVTKTFTIGGVIYKTEMSDDNNEIKTYVAIGTPVRITNVDAFRYAHLQSFDMSQEDQRFLLTIAMDDVMVAPNKESVNPDSVHRYYIEDKESEAKETISKSTLVLDAMQKIKSMSLEEMTDYARLLQIFRPDISRMQIEAELMRLAIEKPADIIAVASDRNAKHKILLKKLVNAQILEIRGGKFMNGAELIGANEDFAIEFLRDANNSKLVEDWIKMLTPKKTKKKEDEPA